MTEPVFTFRPLSHAELPLLHEWLQRAHVARWWEESPSLEHVQRTYGADIHSEVVRPLLACLDGEPVGYAHVYRVIGADPEWWTDETDPGARGIDQFLADERQLGRGLGTALVRQLVARIFAEDPAATKVQTDPAPDNGRAIRAYEKAGFRRIRDVTTPDGPAVLMVVRRGDVLAPPEG